MRRGGEARAGWRRALKAAAMSLDFLIRVINGKPAEWHSQICLLERSLSPRMENGLEGIRGWSCNSLVHHCYPSIWHGACTELALSKCLWHE